VLEQQQCLNPTNDHDTPQDTLYNARVAHPTAEPTEPQNDRRPSTLIRQIGGRPQTPDTTPRPLLLTRHGNTISNATNEAQQHRKVNGVSGGLSMTRAEPTTPKSLSGPACGLVLPLTPQDTPEQTRNSIRGAEYHSSHQSGVQHFKSSPVSGYTAVFQPGKHGHHAARCDKGSV
jgi:hypothetical protein